MRFSAVRRHDLPPFFNPGRGTFEPPLLGVDRPAEVQEAGPAEGLLGAIGLDRKERIDLSLSLLHLAAAEGTERETRPQIEEQRILGPGFHRSVLDGQAVVLGRKFVRSDGQVISPKAIVPVGKEIVAAVGGVGERGVKKALRFRVASAHQLQQAQMPLADPQLRVAPRDTGSYLQARGEMVFSLPVVSAVLQSPAEAIVQERQELRMVSSRVLRQFRNRFPVGRDRILVATLVDVTPPELGQTVHPRQQGGGRPYLLVCVTTLFLGCGERSEVSSLRFGRPEGAPGQDGHRDTGSDRAEHRHESSHPRWISRWKARTVDHHRPAGSTDEALMFWAAGNTRARIREV